MLLKEFNKLILLYWDLSQICTEIGINEWFEPQISEHCPKYFPIRRGILYSWLLRPGRASTFKPKLGIEKEWITSEEVTKIRDDIKAGKIILAVLVNSRGFLTSSKDSCS